MKHLLRAAAVPLFGPMELYQVWRLDAASAALATGAGLAELDAQALAASPSQTIREQAWYSGSESAAFGWYESGLLVAACFYWWGARYEQRNFWPLAPHQAKLVQIVTAPEQRGKGIARRLIQDSATHMFAAGFERLYARVWHSNTPSSAAFRAAGWRRVALVLRCEPGWRDRPLRLCIGQRPQGASSPR